jgi:hypothetical protein
MKTQYALLLVVFFTLGLFSANAQNKIGIRAGSEVSAMYKDGSRVSGTDIYSSFYAGVFRDKKIIPLLHFGMGFEYLQNGAGLPNDQKLVLRYLSVPLYLKAKFGPVFALSGVGANFKLSEKVYDRSTTSNPDQKSKVVDFPFFVGAGVKILIFTVEARYHWGLVKINEGASAKYLQLGAAVSF